MIKSWIYYLKTINFEKMSLLCCVNLDSFGSKESFERMFHRWHHQLNVSCGIRIHIDSGRWRQDTRAGARAGNRWHNPSVASEQEGTHRWLSSGWIHTSTGGYEPIVGCLLDGSTHLQEGKHPSLVDFLGEGVGIERLCLLIHVDPGGGQNRLYAPNRWCADTDRIFRWPLGWSSVCVRWFGWLRGTDKDRIWFPPSVV